MVYKRILVPLDGSPSSWKAFRKALLLAEHDKSQVVALSVEERMPQYAATIDEVQETKEELNGFFNKILAQAKDLAQEQNVPLSVEVKMGHAAQTITHYAKEKEVDLIAMGHVGHSGVLGLLMGSTTDRVVEDAHCDVLVVRQYTGHAEKA
jgi:nucleotide-binding universal stress UspA family protein